MIEGGVWNPTADVRAVGERASVRYLFAELIAPGEQREPSAALASFSREVVHAWKGVTSGGMVRPSDRRNGGHDPHLAGIAVDLMLAPGEGRAAFGDALASWCVEHAEALGLQYVLFSRFEWSSSSSGPRWEHYTGTDPHVDHVHVELGPDARAWSAEAMRGRVLVALADRGGVPWVGLGLVAACAAGAWWCASRSPS